MAIRYLKESKSQSERREDDAKVKAIVEDTLADIEAAVTPPFASCLKNLITIPRIFPAV